MVMPLRKTNAELMIAKGIEQKVPDALIPDESLVVAENVDFSKVGSAKKRAGFVRNSNLILGAGVLDEVRRLGARQRREVLCVTETVTNIGSQAGVGGAGDTLFSYSEETQRWIVRGKMPRPNIDVAWTSGVASPGTNGVLHQYVVTGAGNYVAIAYQAQDYSTIRVLVLDVGGDVGASLREGPTVVLDTTFQTDATNIVGWAQAEGNMWLFYSYPPDSVSLDVKTYARAFRLSTMALDATEILIRSEPSYFVSTDGTEVFLATRFGAGGYELIRMDSELIQLAADHWTSTLYLKQEVAIDARSGYVDLVRHDMTTGRVNVSRHNKATLTPTLLDAFVTTGEASAGGYARSNATIATVGEDSAVILWANQGSENVTTRPTYLSCGMMRMTTGALMGYFSHMGLVPYAQPFIIDGRVYFIGMHSSGLVRPSLSEVTGTTPADESFMCFQIPIDDINPYTAPLPVGQWDYGACIAKHGFGLSAANGTYWMDGRHVFQTGSAVYVLTNLATYAGASKLEWNPAPRLVRLEFGDAAHRWRHEEFHDTAAFTGAVPYMYDGTRAYEMATALHRPVPLAWGVEAGGSLTADVSVFIRCAMLFVDGNGRECWSQPSATVEVLPTGANLRAYFFVMPVTTTMKPDMGNSSLGRMKLVTFAATQDAPNEFRAVHSVEVSPFSIDAYLATFDSIPQENSLMYTAGFELDNFPPPPCRVMAVHSGRLFAIASDSNELCYSKPFNRERGVEFALGQTIPLPDKGTALASLNDRLAVFTHRSILAVTGDGPSVTGSPPDAFSRPVLVSPDYGCVEYAAVGRTPLGVIFRGHQGFYLLDMGFNVQYIGGSVEDITRAWTETRSIVNDQKNSCCRIVGWNGDRSEELCFWYDTKRWSMNILERDVVDQLVLGDNLLVGVADTTVAVASRYRLGSRASAIEYQDFGSSYDQVVETGWLSFQQAGVFKRVWRVYALVRSLGAQATVRIQTWVDWSDQVSSDRQFELEAFDTEPRNLRVHLKYQKLKALKVRVTVSSDGAGAEILKLGFELGLRAGGPKEVREQSG